MCIKTIEFLNAILKANYLALNTGASLFRNDRHGKPKDLFLISFVAHNTLRCNDSGSSLLVETLCGYPSVFHFLKENTHKFIFIILYKIPFITCTVVPTTPGHPPPPIGGGNPQYAEQARRNTQKFWPETWKFGLKMVKFKQNFKIFSPAAPIGTAGDILYFYFVHFCVFSISSYHFSQHFTNQRYTQKISAVGIEHCSFYISRNTQKFCVFLPSTQKIFHCREYAKILRIPSIN